MRLLLRAACVVPANANFRVDLSQVDNPWRNVSRYFPQQAAK